MRHLILLALTSVVVAQPGPPAIYDKSFSDRYCIVTQDEPRFAEDKPLESPVSIKSPIGSSTARVVRTDGSMVPYDDAEAHITVESAFGEPIYFKSKGFRTVDVQWMGERFLFIRKGIGHIVAIEEIYDIVDRRWLVQQTVSYTWP